MRLNGSCEEQQHASGAEAGERRDHARLETEDRDGGGDRLDRAFGRPEQSVKAEVETKDKTEVVWNWTPELLAEVRRLGLSYTPLGPYSVPHSVAGKKPADDEPPPLQ